MNELTQGIIVVLVTGLIVGAIFWLISRQKRQREAALRTLASSNGWTYEAVNERNESGYRLRKGEWMIEALNQSTNSSSDNSNSTTVTSQTRWFSDAVRMQDGIILIGPRQPEINLGGLRDVMMQMALRLMIGSDAYDAAGIQQVELGSLELMRRYMVWTNHEEIAKKMVDQTLENNLLAFPGKIPIVIKFSPAGLEIKVQGLRLQKEQDLYALVKLGSTLLDSAYQVEKA